MSKKLLALFLVLIFAFSLVACGENKTTSTTDEIDGTTTTKPTSTEEETFKLGCYFQLTGGNAVAGAEAKDVVLMAIEHINANGGMNGVMIEPIIYDTQGLPEEAVKVVTKMIESDNVNAVLGSVNSSDVLAAAGYLNDAGIYNLGCGTSNSWMAKDWPFVFRAAANNSSTVPFAVGLLTDLDYTSAAIFNSQDDSAVITANAFKDECEKLGINITVHEQCNINDTDFSAQTFKIVNSNPDCVYVSTLTNTTAPFIKQLRQAGYTGMIFNKDPFMTFQSEIVGEEGSDYIAFVYPYVVYEDIDDCNIPIMKEFLQNFYNKYDKNIATVGGYPAWDSMMVLWEASKIAGSNESDALRLATHEVVIDGLGGKLDFTSGSREGYEQLESFIFVDGKNIPWKTWIEEGGYTDYLAATGNEK